MNLLWELDLKECEILLKLITETKNKCIGSIISKKFILSAAHCFIDTGYESSKIFVIKWHSHNFCLSVIQYQLICSMVYQKIFCLSVIWLAEEMLSAVMLIWSLNLFNKWEDRIRGICHYGLRWAQGLSVSNKTKPKS